MSAPFLSQRRHELFATLWATAHLFQLASVTWIFTNLRIAPTAIGFTELALMVACIGLLFNPAARGWLLLVAALQILDSLLTLPHMPNHRLITSCVNLGILLSYASARSVEECFARLAPGLRGAVIVVYGFVTFHKLNSSFFAPDVSCTTVFYGHIVETLPFLPQHQLLLQFLPFATIAVEGGLPLLLLFPRSRVAGLFVGLLFHSMLTLDVAQHFFDFSSTMFALLSAFLPDSAVRAFHRVPLATRTREIIRAAALWYLTSMIALMLMLEWPPGYSVFYAGRQILWWVLNAWIVMSFAATVRGTWPDGAIERFAGLSAAAVIVPVLLFLNGITPYLGLKTRSSLDMYSNLRAEVGRENHFLVRRSLDLLGKTGDLVEVLSTSDPDLERDIRKPGLLITFFELHRRVRKNPDMQLFFRRAGTTHALVHAGDYPMFAKPLPPLLARLLWFRPVDPNTPARCLW